MANITINTFVHTITKDTASKYTIITPADLTGTTTPTITAKLVNLDLTVTSSTTYVNVDTSTSYEFKLDEGLYLIEFTGYHASNVYYILVGSYQSLLNCMLKITKNLIENNLCNDCYKCYDKDKVILFTVLNYMVKLDHYWTDVQTESAVITTIDEIAAYSEDSSNLVKLVSRIATYCDDCYKPCGC